MPDMNEFLELAHRAGIGTLNSLAIAKALEISTSYVAKLRSGVEPVRPPIRAKLDALIEAKGDGPAEVETVDVAFMQAPHPIDTSDACEPRFHVNGNADGGWDVVEKEWVLHHSIVARVTSTAGEEKANRIAELLNKEGG